MEGKQRAMKQNKKNQSAPKSFSKSPHVLEVGSPFFIQESHKKLYLQSLRRQLNKDRLFLGRKEIQWKAVESPNASILNAPRTDLGPLALTGVAASHNYGRQDLLLPLEDFFPKYQFTFLDMGWRKGLIGEHLFSVPQHISIRLLFFRKDLLQKYFFKPPQTWEELQQQTSVILKGEADEKLQGLIFNFNPAVRFTMFLDYIWTQGLELYENGPDWSLNHKAAETALRQMETFLKNGITPAQVMNWEYENPYKEFLEGRAVFLHHWSDAIQMIQELPESQREQFGWCPVPSFSLKIPGKSTVGGLNYVIPKNTRFPEAAAKVLQSIMQENFQSWYAEHLGSPYPGLKSVYLESSVRQARPYLDQAEFFLRHGKLVEECPYFQGDFQDWITIGGQEVTFFLKGKSSIPETIQRMEERFSALLPRSLYSRLTTQSIEYIQTHLEKPMKVGIIARQLEVTPEHLCRVFKQDTRQTPLQYINDAKMDRAKILLKKSQLTVGEIAYRLGYKSRDHFSRLFHQLVKRSPREYRN